MSKRYHIFFLDRADVSCMDKNGFNSTLRSLVISYSLVGDL